MATRFPCTRNLSASQITMGVLPVPPTLKLPILMTAAFSRFCLSQPFRYIRTRASTPAPYSKESGQRRSERNGLAFIVSRHSGGVQFLQTPGRWPPGYFRQGCAPFHSSLSCARGFETTQSRPPRHPRGFRPEWPRRQRRSARRFPQNSPSTRSEEHTSELQSRFDLVCRLLLEKKKKKTI